ncbi:hypothetical protein HON52_02725 [Candidatus Uhrbacteria bacterium]|nr:hypothetical protein [Candidatus Uhrbacteria bacterium]
MTEENVYGVNPDEEVTPIKVRDAIVKCFIATHKDSLELEEGTSDETAVAAILQNVIQAFIKTGGNFEEPTKESLLEATKSLKEFSSQFRDQEVIDKHFREIKSLIDRME